MAKTTFSKPDFRVRVKPPVLGEGFVPEGTVGVSIDAPGPGGILKQTNLIDILYGEKTHAGGQNRQGQQSKRSQGRT